MYQFLRVSAAPRDTLGVVTSPDVAWLAILSAVSLFYITDRHLVSATVTTTPSFQASPPQRLFPIGPFREYGIFNRNYEVMPDDRRFLMIRRDEDPTARLVAVFNWPAQLR